MTTNQEICPYCEEPCDLNTCPKYGAYKKVQDPEVVKETLKELGVDPEGDRLTVMMQMQKLFAARFHKVDFFTKDEVDYWMKAYDTCVTDEVTEVHEHLTVFDDIYEKPLNNKYELQKEFIDIWHFLMDEFIVGDMNENELIGVYENEIMKYNIPSGTDPLEFIFGYEKKVIEESGKMDLPYEGEVDSLSILIASGHLLAGQRKIRHEISWKHWKKPSATIDYEKLHQAFALTFSALIKCFILSDLTPESLYSIYVIKNCENHWRQKLGY